MLFDEWLSLSRYGLLENYTTSVTCTGMGTSMTEATTIAHRLKSKIVNWDVNSLTTNQRNKDIFMSRSTIREVEQNIHVH